MPIKCKADSNYLIKKHPTKKITKKFLGWEKRIEQR